MARKTPAVGAAVLALGACGCTIDPRGGYVRVSTDGTWKVCVGSTLVCTNGTWPDSAVLDRVPNSPECVGRVSVVTVTSTP